MAALPRFPYADTRFTTFKMKARVVRESHDASYADPIRVAKGAFLTLTRREDVWDGRRRLAVSLLLAFSAP